MRRLPTWSRVALLAVVGALIPSPANSQGWTEIGPTTLALPSSEGAGDRPQRVDLHNDIVLVGNGVQAAFDAELRLRFGVREVLDGLDAEVVTSGLHPVAGETGLWFPLPLLPVGVHDVVLVGKNVERRIGRIEVPPFRVYFNRPGDPRLASSLDAVVPHVCFQEMMARLIDRARRQIDIAMSDFDHPAFVRSVVAAHERGVRIRFVTDARQVKDEPKARATLKAAGVPFITNGRDVEVRPMKIMHHKFLVLDGRVVWTGHGKADQANLFFNQSCVTLNGHEVADIYTREFETLWGGREMESVAANRRFALAKRGPRRHRCQVRGLDGPVDVEVVFAPAEKYDLGIEYRPIAQRLVELADAAKSEVLYMASGFGDNGIGAALARARDRGVSIVGMHGEPDWSRGNHMVRTMRGEGSKPWDPPADIVGHHEMTETGRSINVHNRVMMFDVLAPDGNPVVCFSSGSWRNGKLANDDNMVVIRDRRTADQLLQHMGGNMLRAHRPLPHRNIRPKLVRKGGRYRVALEPVVRLAGGEVTRRPLHGPNPRILARLGNRTLCSGYRPNFLIPAGAVSMAGSYDADLVDVDALAHFGLGLRLRADGTVVLRGSGFLEIALTVDDDVLAGLAGFRPMEGERWGDGLTLRDGPSSLPVTASLAMLADAGRVLRSDGGLVGVRAQEPALVIGPPHNVLPVVEKKAWIWAYPECAVAVAEVARRWHEATGHPLHLADGPKIGARSATGFAPTKWKPVHGRAFLLTITEEARDVAGADGLRKLIGFLIDAGFLTVVLDPSLVMPHGGAKNLLPDLGGGDEDWIRSKGKKERHKSTMRRATIWVDVQAENTISVECKGRVYRVR